MKDENKKNELVRVNINLPKKIIERVREYADSLGIPMTQAYIVLIDMALQYKDMVMAMPALLQSVQDLKTITDKQDLYDEK